MRKHTIQVALLMIALVIASMMTTAQQIKHFSTPIAGITKAQIADEFIIPVNWSVSDRPENTNLVFVQVMPSPDDETSTEYRNAELPRDFVIVASEGDGWLAPVLPSATATVLLFEMHLVDLSNDQVLIKEELFIPIVEVIPPIPTTNPVPLDTLPTPSATSPTVDDCAAFSQLTIGDAFQPADGAYPAYMNTGAGELLILNNVAFESGVIVGRSQCNSTGLRWRVDVAVDGVTYQGTVPEYSLEYGKDEDQNTIFVPVYRIEPVTAASE